MTNVAQDMATKSQDADAVAAQAQGGQRKKKVDLVFWLSVAWIVVLVVFVVLGDLNPLVPAPDERDRELINAAPTWSSPMGNTNFGESVFAQTVIGGRISIFIASVVTAIGIIVGGGLGLLAGYLKGWVDGVVRLVINVTLSVPALLLVIFIVVVRGRSTLNIIIAVSVLAIPALARIMRASTLQVADREFVKAAEVLGVKRSAILVREVLSERDADTVVVRLPHHRHRPRRRELLGVSRARSDRGDLVGARSSRRGASSSTTHRTSSSVRRSSCSSPCSHSTSLVTGSLKRFDIREAGI